MCSGRLSGRALFRRSGGPIRFHARAFELAVQGACTAARRRKKRPRQEGEAVQREVHLQGDGGTFRYLRIATQKLELPLTGTLIAGINKLLVWLLLLAFCTCCAMLRSSCWPAIRWHDLVPLQGRRLAWSDLTGTAPPARPTRSGRLYVSSPSGHVGDGRLAAPTARDLRRSIVRNDACRRNSRGHMATGRGHGKVREKARS